jgi:hypothetical protein
MRHLLALYAPFWLMQRIAAIYLADVLEKDQKVALTFIQQTAFAKPYHTIHIRQGRVAKEDQESPIIQIGGPGYVVVAMDSAVVVERPDGTARVIGPTAKRLRTVREHPSSDQHSSALIEGFERIRQGIDLRDIIQKQNVTSRSRDGIPVTAKNIQYSYSLYRGPKPSVESPQTPYPFDENAIFNLVYGAARPVKPGDPLARANIHDWLDPLPGKIFGQISSEMNSFINKRSLSDFLITTENDNNLEIYPQNSLETTPHGSSILTKIFYDNFQAKAAQRGIQLNWIKMGDWSTPDPIDLRRPTITHLQVSHPREVWEISRENLARGNPTELQRISNDARLNELIRLIQDISIKTSDLSTRTINIEKEKQIDDEQIILRALKEHLDVFKKARDFYRRDNIPIELLIVIREIERWL